jgi:hypothetical protein
MRPSRENEAGLFNWDRETGRESKVMNLSNATSASLLRSAAKGFAAIGFGMLLFTFVSVLDLTEGDPISRFKLQMYASLAFVTLMTSGLASLTARLADELDVLRNELGKASVRNYDAANA